MPKRKPSGYNLFIKKCMNENKDKFTGKKFGAAGPVMKECTVEWKSLNDSQKQSFADKVNDCVLNEGSDKWDCPV